MERVLIGFPEILFFLVGFGIGLCAAALLGLFRSRAAQTLAQDLLKESETRRRAAMGEVMDQMKASFGMLSLDALGKSTAEFLKLAGAHLGAERDMAVRELHEKKGQIDDQLSRMTTELDKVSLLVRELEKDRVEKFGDLSRQITSAREQTESLLRTTDTLRQALAGSRTRGQWGERMAEDVLRMAGFIENVNYLRQKPLQGAGGRPDFTFLLPRGMKLNMDVKFPLDNYLRMLEASSALEQARFRDDFLRDVRSRMKEVTTRDYIDPGGTTLDFVLLFIPNEHVYAFIHEQDRTVLDASIRQKVVLCSPLTLFAILAVIRQAVDHFTLERTSAEIVSLLGTFHKQWSVFLDKLDLVGKRISEAHREYEALITTRRRQLEKPLRRIEELRVRRAAAPDADPRQSGSAREDDTDPGLLNSSRSNPRSSMP